MSGRWHPGEVISTYAIAQELGVSRTPIVEAVKRLEGEGALKIVPQVGCVVQGPEPDQVRETFLIRAALEGLAAEFAASKITDSDLEEIEEIVVASEEAGERIDARRYEELNRAFHNRIAHISGIGSLEQTLRTLWQLSSYQVASVPFFEHRFEESVREHRTILKHLRENKAGAARETTEAHLRRCAEEFATFLEESTTEVRA